MKKVTTKIVSLMLSLALIISIFSACDWITVNTDRNMSQVIATVQISDEVEAEDIKKSELNAGYLSYGYQYVSYYSYTVSKAYQTVLDNLVSNRIVVQQSKIELAKTYNDLLSVTNEASLTEFEKYFKNNALANKKAINPSSSEIENLKKYLTDYEYAKVMYETRKNINDLIKSYVEEDKDETTLESAGVTDRTAPTADEEETKTETELKSATPTKDEIAIAKVTLGEAVTSKTNTYDLNKALYDSYKIDVTSTTKRKKAFSELLAFLKENGLITSNESQDYVANVDNVLNYSYFTNMTKTLIEGVIVDKYEQSLKASTEAKITNDALWEEYDKEYKNQEALYKNDVASYENALNSASDTSFVLYNPYEGYGYVMNLLIPFSTEQSETIKKYNTDNNITSTNPTALSYRESVANSIMAKDLRDSWVYSSHGEYNKTDKSFTFDEDYRTSKLDSLSKFIGEVVVRGEDGKTEKDDNGVENITWSFANAVAKEISLNSLFADYITPATGIEKKFYVENDASTIGKVSNYNETTLDNFNDLMYAFSSDTGCLGKKYGYLYSPYISTYVAEFESASKAVIAGGVGSYTTVLTDYGYHVIICTKLVETTYTDDASGKTKFLAELNTADTLANNYKKAKLDTVVNDEISKIASKLVNDYKDDTTKVTYFKGTYKDLITEEE